MKRTVIKDSEGTVILYDSLESMAIMELAQQDTTTLLGYIENLRLVQSFDKVTLSNDNQILTSRLADYVNSMTAEIKRRDALLASLKTQLEVDLQRQSFKVKATSGLNFNQNVAVTDNKTSLTADIGNPLAPAALPAAFTSQGHSIFMFLCADEVRLLREQGVELTLLTSFSAEKKVIGWT